MSQQDISLNPTKTTAVRSRLLPWILMAMRSTTLLVKFLFTLFIAKYLSLDALGIYGLVSAAGIVSPAVFGLGIMHLLSRAAVHQPLSETKADLKHYFKYLTSLFFIAGTLTLGYFVIRGEWMLALLILFVILFEHLNSELYQLMINLSRPVLADILHFTRSASWVLIYMSLATFYISLRDIHSLMVAWLIGTALCTLVYCVVLAKLPRSSLSNKISLWSWLRMRCKQSSWLYVNGIATTGANYTDRYLIGAFLNLELTGLYVFFWQIQSALSNLIYTGFIQIARPEFVRNFAQTKPQWKMVHNLIRNTAVMAVIFSILALIGMALVIKYLNMPLVDEYYNLLMLILVAFIFNVIAEAQVLVFYSKYKDHLVSLITLVVFAVNLVGCICSIPFWGLWGAGVAAIFSALTRVLLLAWFINGFKTEHTLAN